MRSAGAARREPEPPPDAAAVIAGLGRVITGSGEVHARLRRHERRIASVIARMERDADLAALAGELRTALATVTVELISDAAHCAELREQAEALAPLVAFREMMTATLIAEGRRLEQAERDAAEAERARPVRHRHRKPGLTLVTGAAAASLVAAASAGVGIAAQDSAAVHHVASRPAAARFEAGFPGSAVPVPSWSPSAKPSADVKAARPAPVVTASPPPPSPPPAPAPSVAPPPPPAPPAPSPSLLLSARNLDLSGPTGTFTITATGGSVNWWVSTDIPGASVDVRQGVLSPGQAPVTITVTDPPGGEAGYVYVKWDGGGIASVWVTPSAGAPVVALP
jgi:hypothetical protein